MTLERSRPALDGDERAQLVGWLDLQRAIVLWKCEGVSEEDANRVVLPSSPLMTIAGMLAHLRWTEHCWFEVLFLGQGQADNPQFGEVEDADWMPDGKTLAQLAEEYRAQCARSNEITAAHELHEPGRNPDFKSGQASLRYVLTHMVEETARHAGQLDIVRELVDGQVGYF